MKYKNKNKLQKTAMMIMRINANGFYYIPEMK